MDKKTKIISIIEKISSIFSIKDNVKVDLFNKLDTFSDDKLVEIAKVLVDYDKNQFDISNNLLSFLKITKNNFIELEEKKNFLGIENNFFNNL